MQFHRTYRKNFNDLSIAVENFDISLSDEFKALKILNSDKIIRYQIKKFESTFEMLIKQIKLYLIKEDIVLPKSAASLIQSFHKHSPLNQISYESMIDMNVSYRKLSLAYEQKTALFYSDLYQKLDNYYTTLLLALVYFDYDDEELIKANIGTLDRREFAFLND